METEKVLIKSLKAHPKNVRQGDVGAISESLRVHGQYKPIVVQRSTKHILAGNHTWKAARTLGWTHIDVVWADVDNDEAVRILLADNRTTDLATYDDHALLELLAEVARTDQALLGTGFDGDDLDLLMDDIVSEPAAQPATEPAATAAGGNGVCPTCGQVI